MGSPIKETTKEKRPLQLMVSSMSCTNVLVTAMSSYLKIWQGFVNFRIDVAVIAPIGQVWPIADSLLYERLHGSDYTFTDDTFKMKSSHDSQAEGPER